MACKGFFECLLKLLNFLLTLVGLAMVGYGVYLLIIWKKSTSGHTDFPISDGSEPEQFRLVRPFIYAGYLSANFWDKLPTPWFIYLFIAIGAILFVISCIGCIGAATRNICCLSCYSVLLVLLIVVELGLAAFIFFDHNWEKEIPNDKTGDFNMIYNFLKENWKIAKWVALGAVILEALVFLLALAVRAANMPPEYDSDDEYIAPRQPLISRAGAPATGIPVNIADQRQNRPDAWSTRMKEKYGLDTSEFTYNPSESGRYTAPAPAPAEERSRCTIM
ncbi:hypothetical protein AMTRI_Chr03g44460 [Amborella trichopoda]|uniref:Tobamovirus multiplication protein 2A n=2 Tax=Amborella trichopoda TaxID=13333 RepID=W1PNK4_AMBTC|nr:hypothetical protein AMTR_s00022p00189290 [Amborella trichopoda]